MTVRTLPPIASVTAALRRPHVRRALLAAGVATLLALAAWAAAHAIRPGALADAFASVSWPWLVAAAVAYALGQIASGLVWGVGLRAGGMRGIQRRHVLSAHWLGHGACELLPAQLGHVVRYAAIRRHPAAAAGGGLRIAGSVGAWKVVDGLVTFVVVAIATMVMPLPGGFGGLRWLAGGDAGRAAAGPVRRLPHRARPRGAHAPGPARGRGPGAGRGRGRPGPPPRRGAPPWACSSSPSAAGW